MRRSLTASFALSTLVALAATLGTATESLAGVVPGVGDPTGTTYGVSGKNYGGLTPGSFESFGTELLYHTDAGYAEIGDFTQDEQLDPMGGSPPVTLTFDGIAEAVNGLLINESYQVWDPDTFGVPVGHNGAIGFPDTAPIPVALWDKPRHMVEISFKDTAGSLNEGGGLNRDIFAAGILRVDAVTPEATTPDGGLATPLFVADRNPEQEPGPLFDGQATGNYFYFRRNDAPSNPSAPIALPTDVLQGDHPTLGAAQQVYYIVFSSGDFDDTITHDIAPGTWSFNSDTGRELDGFDPNANLVTLASFLSINFDDDIDELVFGNLYTMVADGDGDLNGKVDGLDYLRWAANFGTTPVNDPLPEEDGGFAPIDEAPSPNGNLDFKRYYGDYNNSGGPVDGLDYLKWAGNFGFVGDGSDTLGAAVPEPGTFALAGLALAGLLVSRRRR
jgi:hypothetical protein